MNLLMLFSAVDFRKIVWLQHIQQECRPVKAVIGALTKTSLPLRITNCFPYFQALKNAFQKQCHRGLSSKAISKT